MNYRYRRKKIQSKSIFSVCVSAPPACLTSHLWSVPATPFPLISSHSFTDPARWPNRHPFFSTSITSPYISSSISSTVVRIRFQIPLYPASSRSLYSPASHPPPHCLTNTRAMRWWRNNTDTWYYSICALDPGPKSIVISRSPKTRNRGSAGMGVGSTGCWGHHSTEFSRGVQK